MPALALLALFFSVFSATTSAGLRRFIAYDGEPRVVSCGSFQFKCTTTNKCIHKAELCDGRDDCGDRSDETKCTTCQHVDLFRCTNASKCIPKLRECDRVIDCPDGSDEQNCTCHEGAFRCKTTRNPYWRSLSPCLSWHDVCDGIKDCPQGEDESPYACCESTWPFFRFITRVRVFNNCFFFSLAGNATFQRQLKRQQTVNNTPAIDLGKLFLGGRFVTITPPAYGVYFFSCRSFTDRKNLPPSNLHGFVAISQSRRAISGTEVYTWLLHGSLREARTTGLRQQRCLRELRSVSQELDKAEKPKKTVSV